MIKKYICIFISMALFVLFFASCSGSKVESIYDYLGDYSYDASMIAMVYEDFEGQGFGVLYRRVNDFSGLVATADCLVLLYFYTSMHADYAGTTAAIEQIAENYHDQILVVAIDVFQEGHIAEHYEIETVPEFIMLDQSYIISRFNSAQRGQWPNEDVDAWVQQNLSY